MNSASEPESDLFETHPTRLGVLQAALGFEGGLAVLALFFAWLSGREILGGINWDGRSVATGLVASLPMFGLLAMTARSQASPFVRIRRILSDILLPWMSQCRTIDLLLISILAGVGEELLFRAFLQSLLGDWLGVASGLVVASLLFGVAHWITTGYAVLAAVAGFYLGAVWLATGENTAVVIITHAFYDFVALTLLLKWHRSAKLLRGFSEEQRE